MKANLHLSFLLSASVKQHINHIFYLRRTTNHNAIKQKRKPQLV
jgi:hypothetical protein